MGEKGQWRKYTLWEDATHVPLLVVAPGVTTPGSRSSEPVSTLDIYPTLADLAGLSQPGHLEGHSLRPLLEDPTAEWHHQAVTTYRFGNHSVRTRHYRYIRYSDGGEEIYDHREDPHEWRNLAPLPGYEDMTRRLRALLLTVNAEPIEAIWR
ncbi:MAG: sulfatase-like hydrolase/transferase [Bryobacterales bacterium]|nr:sulfatase-like hydrolase/transferase [Bryobacterales bacterium]